MALTDNLNYLEDKAQKASDALRTSKTAYAPNTLPTSGDVGQASSLAAVNKQIEDLKSTALRNRWYGADTTDVPAEGEGDSSGWLMGGLKALQRPLNAIAGTAQYALGKGTKSSLVENVNEAMKTGLTFGNVLGQEGITNRWAQVPLGFALDVMFDPVNWLTFGGALIPKTFMGLVKGGFKTGAREIAEAGLETGAKTLAKTATEKGLQTGLKPAVLGWGDFRNALGEKISGLNNAVKEGVSNAKQTMSGGWSPSRALETGVAGATSNLARKLTTAMKLVPFAKKSETYSGWVGKLGEKALASSEKYDRLMGTDVYDKLGKGLFGMPSGIIGNTLEDLVREVPAIKIPFTGKMLPSGDKIADFFKYSTIEASKVTQLFDDVKMLGKEKGMILGYTEKGPWFKKVEDFLAPDAEVKMQDLTKKLADKVVADADGMVAIRDSAGKLKPEFFGQLRVTNSIENAKTLLEMEKTNYNLKHLIDAYKVTPIGKTGVAWYDDFIDKVKATNYKDIVNFVRTKAFKMEPLQIEKAVQNESEKLVKAWNFENSVKENLTELPGAIKGKISGLSPSEWKPFEKVLNGLEEVTNIFKATKVAYNFASQIVAVAGNFVMGLMGGIPVTDKKFLMFLRETRQMLGGKLSMEQLKRLFFDDTQLFFQLGENNPTRFKEIWGFHPNEILEKINIGETIKNVFPSTFGNIIKKLYTDSINELERLTEYGESFTRTERGMKELSSRIDKITEFESGLSETSKKFLKNEVKGFSTPVETNKLMRASGDIPHAEEIGTFSTAELQQSRILDTMKSKVKKLLQDNPNDIKYVYLDKFVNGLPKMYEHIDQTFKITTTNFLSRWGVNRQRLEIISSFVPLEKTDITEVIEGGEKLFRLSPVKAAEAAMENFMNYSAMPDFVKIIRSLPILGSNFYSFQYAMAIKTAKTAINNPALFNKVGFAINEMNAGRTPEEKAAMEDKYNKYLKSDTVMKMFGLWNTDVKNIVPYLSMNMFNPSQRNYDDSAQGKFLKALDKTPLFQNPVGQILRDYWIQPWLLSGTNQIPQGQFGQPLMPYFDENGKRITPSLGTNLFYQGRTALESVVPGSASYLGLPLGLMGLSPEMTNIIPSYGIRKMANAVEGRSSIGAKAKEEASRRAIRAFLGISGIPAYTLDPTKSNLGNIIKK